MANPHFMAWAETHGTVTPIRNAAKMMLVREHQSPAVSMMVVVTVSPARKSTQLKAMARTPAEKLRIRHS